MENEYNTRVKMETISAYLACLVQRGSAWEDEHIEEFKDRMIIYSKTQKPGGRWVYSQWMIIGKNMGSHGPIEESELPDGALVLEVKKFKRE